MAKSGVSLSEVHRTVDIPKGASIFKRMFAFFGPAYLVSVGYMDPGNWATDLEGGARFGYTLIWVLLMSNAMAVLLQTLSARLGIVAGRDLAQACRDTYPRSVNYCLWILAEIAIAACDLAEVLGTTIGLNLLFGIPLFWGVIITGFDTLLFLAIQRFGVRKFESLILFLITIVGLCFVFEVVRSGPAWGEVAKGFVPSIPEGALYVAIGIIGATVMPHNLYLHSALVQTRAYDTSPEGKRQACRFNLIDSTLALNAAFFVNAAILIVSAATFYRNGIVVSELQQAHSLLSPLLGTALAGFAFALALLAAGQASTITGTLAGQIVMEGYLHFKIRPFLRRLLTRMVAVVPAALTILFMGEAGTYKLLILSQVILSLQLPFAIIPLIHFTNNESMMGEFANNNWVKTIAWIVATIIVGLNAKLVIDQLSEWIASSPEPVWIYVVVLPIVAGIFLLLAYVALRPFVRFPGREEIPAWKKLSHLIRSPEYDLDLEVPRYKRIGVAVAHTDDDKKVLSHALLLARQHDATLCLFHVVEGAGGVVFGSDAYDKEARQDEQYLKRLAESLGYRGVEVEFFLGFGVVTSELVRLVQEQHIDVLLMAGHGHRGISDILFGSTISPVRHGLDIPIVIVR
ncbi:Nramp family divalent metal transporter [Desulfomonile tiedjei]|uniref:Divalent metal cation transporter MntH n=1 Tax=Desulfomonile tiedjei (strain ATCC 49306 / DSM 6799 / DCB-1) TaxID=706587 RepID=I4C4Z4_DESTA|nr:Nramp family divalent metal transporter [Desulfomonile tiedjei]AFM24635.1 natural resistance-associated macrophage protein metal ion transporter NRAMP [Desulfomonile tiedjei DSM 6799]